jgi:hypothetical protein
MNISTTTVFLMMLGLYIAALISTYIFKIYSNKYYSVYHFVGGGLTYLLILGITKSSLISLAGVLVVGIVWEIHEWILWKYFLKKRVYKPEKKDTRNDLIFDILGAITAFTLIRW